MLGWSLDVLRKDLDYVQILRSEQTEVRQCCGVLWKVTAEECGLLEDFEQKRANSSNVVIDMGRQLCPDARAFYNETLEVRQAANLMRMFFCRAQ